MWPKRFVCRDFIGGSPALDFAGQHFADLANNVIVADKARLLRVQKFRPCAKTPSRLSTKKRARVTTSWSTSTGPA